MWHPLLIVRGVFFGLFIFLSLLGLGFSGAELNVLYSEGKLMAVGPPWFVLLNTLFTFIFVFVGCAEAFTPNARTGRVGFECGWTGVMSVLNFACAIVTITKGPPVYCKVDSNQHMCVSSTFLGVLSWTAFILTAMYCFLLTAMAYTHSRRPGSGNIWNTTVYNAPWIIPYDVSDVESTTSTQVDWDPPKGYHENPVFGAIDEPEEEDLGEQRLSPKQHHIHPAAIACKTRGKDSPFPVRPVKNTIVAPQPTHPPRILDSLDLPADPFRAPTPMAGPTVSKPEARYRISSYFPNQFKFSSVMSFITSSGTTLMPGTPQPPPPPPKGQFVDCHRTEYGHFPDDVADPDLPIHHPPRSEWVTARR